LQSGATGGNANAAATALLYGDAMFRTAQPASAATPGGTACTGVTKRATLVRDKPDPSGQQVLFLDANATVNVIGKTADGTWVLIEANGAKGWLFVSTLDVRCDLSGVPVVDPAAPLSAGPSNASDALGYLLD